MKKLFLSLLLFALVIGVSGASFASNTYINVIEAFELDSNDDIPGPPELYGYTAAGYITSYQHVNGVYMDWVSVNEGSQLGSKYASDTVVISNYISRESESYIPLRLVAEQLGYNVEWSAITNSALLSKGSTEVEYTLDNNEHLSFLMEDKLYVLVDSFTKQHYLNYATKPENTIALYHIPETSADRMMQNLTHIASNPRPIQSTELDEVRLFIMELLDKMGYEVEIQPVLPSTAFLPTSSHLYNSSSDPIGANIVARKPAITDTMYANILILGAKYDSSPRYPGAVTNGSGIVSLLEIAELIKDIPTNIEVNFVFFAGDNNGALGAHQYVSSLNEDDIHRISMMIELDTIGSRSNGAVYVHTLDGLPNKLSELIDEFELAQTPNGAYTSFHSINVPSVKISEDPAATAHYLAFTSETNDSIESVDAVKMQNTADSIAKLIGFLMSDRAALLSQQNSYIDSSTIDKSLSLSVRIPWNTLSKHAIEEHLNGTLYQKPIMPMFGKPAYSSFSTHLDWWGLSLNTSFQFTTDRYLLSDISITVDDVEALISTLDERFERLDSIYDFSFANLPSSVILEDKEASKSLGWKDDNGNAFVLVVEKNGAILWISAYSQKIAFDISDNNDWLDALTDKQRAAWDRITGLLDMVDLLDKVQNVVFIDDGYEGETFSINPAAIGATNSSLQLVVSMDANDIMDSNGALSQADNMLTRLIKSWSTFIFTNNTQHALIPTLDEEGNTISFISGDYMDESYLKQYVKSFGLKWVEAYLSRYPSDANFPKNAIEELAAQSIDNPEKLMYMMITDLQNAFVYYMTGEHPNESAQTPLDLTFAELYGENYDEELTSFFDKFTELNRARSNIIFEH